MEYVTIEETLKSGDLPADLKPHLVSREVVEGARPILVCLNAVSVDYSLIGKPGNKISVPVASQLTGASNITSTSESTIDTSGFTTTDKTITDVDITADLILYVAVRISDILREDQPDIDWVRLLFRNMGAAMAEYRDTEIYDVLMAGVASGNTVNADTGGTLAPADIADAIRVAKGNNWYPEAGREYFCIIHPDQEYDLVVDSTFRSADDYPPERPLVTGEVGYINKCRILVTTQATQALALIIAPPNNRWGTVAVHAVKRRTRVRTEREEYYERQMWVTSARFATDVVQANGLYLISRC